MNMKTGDGGDATRPSPEKSYAIEIYGKTLPGDANCVTPVTQTRKKGKNVRQHIFSHVNMYAYMYIGGVMIKYTHESELLRAGKMAENETALDRFIEALATVKSYSKHVAADPETQAENDREYRRSRRLLRLLYCVKRNRKGSQLQQRQEITSEAPR